MTNKKLGILNYLIIFIYLPIVVISYVLALINNIAYIILAFKDYSISLLVFDIYVCIAICLVVLSAVWVTLSVSKRRYDSLSAVSCYCLCYVAERILYTLSILVYESGKYTPFSIILSLIIYAIIPILIFLYYKKRTHNFDNYSDTGAITTILGIAWLIIGYISTAAVEIITLYQMFERSTWYGFFGLVAPGIAQIVHMFTTGFGSAFSFMIYGYAVIVALRFLVLAAIDYYE